MSVISVQFVAKSPVSVDVPRVSQMLRVAARVLTAHTHLATRVRVEDRGVGTSFVSSDYPLGVTVGVYPSLRRRPFGEPIRDWIARRDAAPRELIVDATAVPEWLLDGRLATEGDFGYEYANPDFLTVEDACAWVRANCHRVPVVRVTEKEALLWKQLTVVVKNLGRRVRISLWEAMQTYGGLYGRSVSVDELMLNHKMRRDDAEKVVKAVRQALPVWREP